MTVSEPGVRSFVPLTDAERREMLARIGAPSVDALFEAVPADGAESFAGNLQKVKVSEVAKDERPFPMVHDPSHPDADPETGMVKMPNVNVVEEMINMITASRSYEANVTAYEALKQMANKAMEIGR